MTPLDVHTAEEYHHKTWCGAVVFERTEHQEIELHTNFVLIPKFGLKIYYVVVLYRETSKHQFEPSFDGLMFFDMVTNEHRYEEGGSGLYPALHNYFRARGEENNEDWESIHVLIYHPEADTFYSHVDDEGSLFAQTPLPDNLCLDVPTSVVLDS